MDFTLSKKHEMARTLFRDFAQNEVKPLAQVVDETECFPRETVEKMAWLFKIFSTEHWAYAIMYFFLILFFAYFYASIQYNPVEMANNIRKNSGMIPGLRPGKPTADYIKKILNRITLLGALLLSVVALFPNVITLFTNLIGAPMQLSLGGTSLIIVVGVALETVKQLESQMMMRHYKGFLD